MTRCESCGRDEPAGEVVAVHRVYVTPAAWPFGDGDDGGEDRLDVAHELERWCFACRSSYPHQLEGSTEPEL